MAYKREILPPVKAFFRTVSGISRPAPIRVFVNLHASLANVSDAYRNDSDNRPDAGSSQFVFASLLRDTDGDGRIHEFRFTVDHAAAEYGVLRIIEAEHSSGP